MNFFEFPTPFIFSDKVEDHEEIKGNILPLLFEFEKKHKNENLYRWSKNTQSDVFTTFNDRNSKFYSEKFLKAVVWDKFRVLMNKKDIFNGKKCVKSQIARIWYNIYHPGDYADFHIHDQECVSGIYILELKEPNGTVFVNQSCLGYHTHKTHHLQEGDVILFPSELPHYVLPATQKRVTISFNIKNIFD